MTQVSALAGGIRLTNNAAIVQAWLDRGHAPDWVRRCVGANHVVTMRAHPTKAEPVWQCATCGKDRP